MTSTDLEIVARKAFAAFNSHDLDTYIGLLDPNYVSRDPMLPDPPKGREAYRKINEDIFKAFPDAKFKILNIASKNGFVAVDLVFSGTFKGPVELGGRTIPPTGRRFEIKMATFAHVNSKGLITELHDYYDPAVLIQQLGMNT